MLTFLRVKESWSEIFLRAYNSKFQRLDFYFLVWHNSSRNLKIWSFVKVITSSFSNDLLRLPALANTEGE